MFQGSPTVHPDPTVHLTDASLLGWEAHWDARAISGRWNPEESERHIKALELDAVARAVGTCKDQLHELPT